MVRIRSVVVGMVLAAIGYFSFLDYVAGDGEEEIISSVVTVPPSESSYAREFSTPDITKNDNRGLAILVLGLVVQSMAQAQERKPAEILPQKPSQGDAPPPVQVPELYVEGRPIIEIARYGSEPKVIITYVDGEGRTRLSLEYHCKSLGGLCDNITTQSDLPLSRLYSDFVPNEETRIKCIRKDNGDYDIIRYHRSSPDPSWLETQTTERYSYSEFSSKDRERRKWSCSTDDGGDCSSFERVVSYPSEASGYVARQLTNGRLTPNDIVKVDTSPYFGDDDTCEYLVHEIPQGASDDELLGRCNKQLGLQ